jgi:ribonuclease Y
MPDILIGMNMLENIQTSSLFMGMVTLIATVLLIKYQSRQKFLIQAKREKEHTETKKKQIWEDRTHEINKLQKNQSDWQSKRTLEHEQLLQALDEENARLDHSFQLIEEREQLLQQRAMEIENKEKSLVEKQESLKTKQRELNFLTHKTKKQLEEKTGTTVKVLSQELSDQIAEQIKVESQKKNQLYVADVELHQDKIAQQSLYVACQRYHLPPYTTDKMTASVDLPTSEKQKQRLLDQDGNLLKEISQIAQVDFQVDQDKISLRNAPESYTREIAKLSYEKWLEGGNLNEQSFKAHYQKTTKLIEKQVHRAGIDAALCLGLKGIHPEILNLVGKLLYRTSYTQNQWHHAIESAQIASMLAEEVGLDPMMARRATLLHDIGKVLWEETEAVGSHAVSGAAFAKDHGEIPEIVHPIAAHHNDEAPKTPLAFLVIAADTLSGARPGARTETAESFSQHVEMLDQLCLEYDGLKGHLVIQGGRELRMFLDPKRYDDQAAALLAQNLATKIEDESVYPGQVKVMTLREVYGSAVAKAPYQYSNQQHYDFNNYDARY